MVCGTQPITHTWACITGIQTVAHAHTHVTASAWCHGPVVFADTIQLLPSSSVHIHTTHTHTHTHTPFVDLVFGKRFQRPPQDFSLSCLLRRLSLFLTSGRSSTSGQAPKKNNTPRPRATQECEFEKPGFCGPWMPRGVKRVKKL